MTSHGGLQSSKASTSSGRDAVSNSTFQKFQSTLEQSLWTATQSKKLPPTPHIVDELARTTKEKEEERPKNIEPQKEKMTILRKVAFGRGRDSLSSPALHTSSQALPSPKSQSAIPVSSSSNTDVVISPTRQRTRKVQRQSQSPEHSSPDTPASPRGPLLSRHPSSKLPPSPSLHRERPRGREATRTLRDVSTPPDTPTPKAHPPAIRSVRALNSESTSRLSLTSPRTPTPPSTPRCSIDTSRRASDTRRPSTESPRHTSPMDIQGESPRTTSPVQHSYSQNRHFNISSGSRVQPTSNPKHRELLRTAVSLICKEELKPPIETEARQRDWKEVEVRTRELARLERVWSKSGSSGDCHGCSNNVSSAALSSCSGLTASGEERERRLFCEALRDGYLLCQLMNKLRSSSVVLPDPREDGFVKTSNVTRFLAACASYGLPNEDLFQRDDLIEATSESLARVAKTVIALFKFVDSPPPSRSKFMSGRATPIPSRPPYGQAVISRASSTPNLIIKQTSPGSSPTRKKLSPPSDLPTFRSRSPDDNNNTVGADQRLNLLDSYRNAEDNNAESKPLIVSESKKPPLRLPWRRPATNYDDTWATNASSQDFNPRSSTTDSTRTSVDDAFRGSVNDELQHVRPSVSSSMLSEATAITTISSMFGEKSNRTMTTDLTSSRTEGGLIVEDLARKRKRSMESNSGKYGKERKISEPAVPASDLSRVAEETDESMSSKGHTIADNSNKPLVKAKTKESDEKPPSKGKWPEDAQMPQAQPTIPDLFLDQDDSSSRESTPNSPKMAVVGVAAARPPQESVLAVPWRPTHRPRHSADVPHIIMPKDAVLRRDSPDSASGRLIVRRHGTKPATPSPSGGILIPRSNNRNKINEDDLFADNDPSLVPFPRTTSAREPVLLNERPRVLHGRFQSEIEGSSSLKRRARPSSYDELSAKSARSKIESMINLGVGSGKASASDLMFRDSLHDSAVRMRLVVREDGKPPTHFQLGNCIGRGQFGSVYRALNLNTGQMVAVKRIRLEGLKEDEVTTLMREVDLVKSLSHPSIVKYEGMARDENTLNIVLEYAENGSLGQTLKAFGKLNEHLVASYVIKILEGLHYLHTSDVVHCDLKAANILTTKNGNVKLSDFGVSLNLRAMEREIKDVAGTPNWMAPEVIELKGASTKSDIWSLGCTVIELLTGRPPYADITNSMSVMFHIVEDDMPPLPEVCSELLQDFLEQCFHKDPARRPSAELLCEHMWLKKNSVELKELRPQDSIPFLRRVSLDFQKSEVLRSLSLLDMSDSFPVSASPRRKDEFRMISPVERRTSHSSLPPLDNDISPREHSFVKTTFGKPVICRVCLLNVKKSAVLCSQCNLISHTKCIINAPPTCNLRAQLLLYAQYAEKGNPASVYSSPTVHLPQNVTLSDVPFVEHLATSTESPLPQTPVNLDSSEYSPTSFKFMAAFKRSRNLSPDSVTSFMPPGGASGDENERRRPAVLIKRHERPLSTQSTSTGLSSLRSTATAAESLSSRRNVEQRSEGITTAGINFGKRRPVSAGATILRNTPKVTSSSSRLEVTYDEHPDTPPQRSKKRGSKESGNCIVQ